MPDTIRGSRGTRHRRRAQGRARIIAALRPFASVAIALMAPMTPLAAMAAEPPSTTLRELILTAQSSIDQHQIASITIVCGVVLFAVVSAIMLVHAWARAARLERRLRKENARLREEVDRANALMRAEPQVIVVWPAGSNEPKIDGEPGAVGVGMPHQVLAFGSWLDAGKATAMERAVDALRFAKDETGAPLVPADIGLVGIDGVLVAVRRAQRQIAAFDPRHCGPRVGAELVGRHADRH